MFDVLMPCRNAPGVFAQAVAHVQAYALSTGLVRQVIVLDNQSSDPAMGPIIQRLAHTPSFTVLRHERNVGVWCSLNRGLAVSGAERVLVITSDVLIGPDTVPVLHAMLDNSPCHFVSPRWTVGMADHAATHATTPPEVRLALDQYNGACWAMRWGTLKDAVGWFDPQFYVCAGDTDYVERLRTRGGDCLPMLALDVVVTHLDKQTRRTDHTALRDSEVEVRDMAHFHAKWAGRPDILARHPMPTLAGQLDYKRRDGGWDEGKVGA